MVQSRKRNSKQRNNTKLQWKIIFNKRLNSPEVFKLTLDEENNVKNIENIEFADLEFDDFNI